jgi:hypothetical protein
MDLIIPQVDTPLMVVMGGIIPEEAGLVTMEAPGGAEAGLVTMEAPGMAGEGISRFHPLTGSQNKNQATARRGCFPPRLRQFQPGVKWSEL